MPSLQKERMEQCGRACPAREGSSEPLGSCSRERPLAAESAFLPPPAGKEKGCGWANAAQTSGALSAMNVYDWNQWPTLPARGGNNQRSAGFLMQHKPPRKPRHLQFITQTVVQCQTVTYLSLNTMITNTHSKNSSVKHNKELYIFLCTLITW